MIDHLPLINEKSLLIDRISELRRERYCAQMIDNTSRMDAEHRRIDQEIGRAQARIAEIEAEIGGVE